MCSIEESQIDLLKRLPLMQVEAGRIGLFKTMHQLHEANRVGGFELAEIMEKNIRRSIYD